MATLAQLPHKKFTRDEVNRLLETDIFAGQRFELIDGELIDKMGQEPPHANAAAELSAALGRVFGLRRIRTQLPIEAGPRDRMWSQPEPDVVVIDEAGKYANRHPEGDELVLLVEVADSTLRHDTNRKREIYANAGVPEYWVVNIQDRKVLIYRKPQDDGYAESLTLSESDLLPHIGKPVAELL